MNTTTTFDGGASPTLLAVGDDLPYRLEMLSDWHTGTGAGRPGDVDRLVIRDADGLPYVPAKTMNGIWRDACEVAARALDRQRPGGQWTRWVEVVFGSQPGQRGARGRPRPGMVSVRAAQYGPAFRAEVLADRTLARAVTFLRPGVKIDPESGRAEKGMLRVEEQARAGAVLHGVYRLHPLPTSDPHDDVSFLDGSGLPFDLATHRAVCGLLLAGAGILEQLGGKRRRGNGRCTLTVAADIDREPWWAWLETATPPPVPPIYAPPRTLPRPAAARSASSRAAAPSGSGTWEVARLRIELVDAVVAGGRTLGNEVLGEDFVPGRNLLPTVLRRLGPAAADALLAGALVVTNATVAIDGEPGRPAPRTFAESKGGPPPRAVVNRASRAALPVEFAGRPTKQVKDGYVAAAQPLRLVRPSMVVRTHNSIGDDVQRPTTDEGGGIYTYRAIAAKTDLVAEVRVRHGLLPDGWQRSLSGDYTFGLAKKDDYGRATVTAERVTAGRTLVWKRLTSGQRLTVWLVSDLLVTDARLRLSNDTGALRKAFENALGLPELALREVGGDGELRPTAVAVRRTESWQARWELPRPTLCGFVAGSVVTYELAAGATLDRAAVERIETEGVGERRGEGFGQVLVATVGGPELVTAFTAGLPVPASKPPRSLRPPVPPPGGDDVPLRLLRTEALRLRIHEEAVRLATTAEGRSKMFGAGVETVTATQLAQLREALPRSGVVADTTELLNRLTDPDRQSPWPVAVGVATRDLLTRRDRVWDLLGLSGLGGGRGDAGTRGVVADRLKTELWAEAVQTVVTTGLAALRRAEEQPSARAGRDRAGTSEGAL